MEGRFPVYHRFDATFWLAFVVVAWTSVLIGFSSQVSLRFTGQADYPAPLVLQLHVWAFTAWLSLLSMQIVLARMGNLYLHRRMGLAGAVLIPLMAWSAIASEIYSQRFYAPGNLEGIRFFPIPVASVTCFVTFAVAAIALRRNAATHKRLIYLATSSILVAAFFRWWGDFLYEHLSPSPLTEWVANYSGVALLFGIGVTYDLATRNRVHRALEIGIPLALAAQASAVAIGQSDWWPEIGRSLLGIA